MTTHQLAAQLLALPDIPVCIEGWVPMKGYKIKAKITSYDTNQAIIVQQATRHQQCENAGLAKRMEERFPTQWVWRNAYGAVGV